MKDTRAQIPGYGRYKLDLITQEVISKEGNIIKTRVDSARTNPRTVVTLYNDDGSRATVEYTNLVKKTVESLEFTPASASILSEVLVAYYNKITPEFKTSNCSRSINGHQKGTY